MIPRNFWVNAILNVIDVVLILMLIYMLHNLLELIL